MGQQSWPGKPPGNRAARGRNLHNPVTAAASQLGPHMANHLEPAGTYSRTSATSSPKWRSSPPQPGHCVSGRWTWISRGKCAGNGLRRTGGRGCDSAGGGEASAASLTCNSSSVSCSWSSMPSSCSERRPNCVRRSLAIISFRCSISPRWAVTKAFKAWMSSGRQSVAQVMARCYWCSPALKIRPFVPVRCVSVGANRCPPTASRVVPSSRIRCRWRPAARRSAPARAACRTNTSHRHPTTAI